MKKMAVISKIQDKAQQFKKAAVNLFALSLFLLLATPASAQGLSKAKGFFELIYSEITTLIPILATLALVGAFLGYMFKLIQKDTFFRWVIGIIGCGSVAQIVAMLYN